MDRIRLHLGLGDTALAGGDLADAAVQYRHVLPLDPRHGEARIKLAHVLKLRADYAGATDILQALAADYPNDPAVPKEFGRLSFMQHRLDDALGHFRRVLQLDPDDADAHHWLANIEHLNGNAAAAQAHYRRSAALKPVIRIRGTRTPPDFSALFLFSPGKANTPPDTLVRQAAYESGFLLLLPDAAYDASQLRSTAHVVVNLVSDGDRGSTALAAATALVDRIGLPVVNHPRAIAKTEREAAAALLSGIPGCHIPRVRRCTRDSLAHAMSLLNQPLLIRVVGTHGGDDFERIEDSAAAEAFATHHAGAEFYLSDYVDYASTDGLFRKYRFFFVADAILPYHLAIGRTWKVHHATTDMAQHPWMQREEAAFLADPTAVFAPQHFAALRAIRQAVGLDFFGIDCAIGPDGRLVVFEVNASMLVHEDNAAFPYKAPAVDRIKHAFDAMLHGMALPNMAS